MADWPPHRRNTARYTFMHPAARTLFADWEYSAATTAANLRAVAAEAPDTPGLAEFIDELVEGSPEFAQLWQRYDVRRRQSDAKSFRHPQIGEITMTYEVLRLDDGQRLSAYQATSATPTKTHSNCWPSSPPKPPTPERAAADCRPHAVSSTVTTTNTAPDGCVCGEAALTRQ